MTMIDAERLIRLGHVIASEAGIDMPPSKVSRIVRRYGFKAEENGWQFVDYFSRQCLDHVQRQRISTSGKIAAEVAALMRPATYGSRDSRRRLVRLETGGITVPLGATTGIPVPRQPIPVFPVRSGHV
jgi:hypothetical protein